MNTIKERSNSKVRNFGFAMTLIMRWYFLIMSRTQECQLYIAIVPFKISSIAITNLGNYWIIKKDIYLDLIFQNNEETNSTTPHFYIKVSQLMSDEILFFFFFFFLRN